ncbi:MAG: hypothetical protein JOY90_25030 [Bradyrhizobium sp.]|uniref:GCG_CRPN prefix-to-repeats domain-containing protein n=1 Tax=Bradyrhizobium sp. TaxID=376 RepID=UPI001D74D413|nr:hypothetical protein [Bradyrhizobium sp.]MBV9563678.1 hypothetical protein [Bradyrhizobium sp.]
MRKICLLLFAAGALIVGDAAHAADGCGPGCHATSQGACVVDGWGSPRIRNECPAGSRPMRPCPRGSRWRFGTCFAD